LTAWIAAQLGTGLEALLFQGDFKAWTTGRIGTGTPFMFLILLPLAYLSVSWGFRKIAGHHFRALLAGRSGRRPGLLDAGRWIVLLVAAMVLSSWWQAC
jgi:phosphate transport system permease protein